MRLAETNCALPIVRFSWCDLLAPSSVCFFACDFDSKSVRHFWESLSAYKFRNVTNLGHSFIIAVLMKKSQKDDKSKKKGWGARLMSLIAGSSDEELGPSDDDQDDMPRGKSGHGTIPAARVQEQHAPIDSRAALKKMLKDPDQKKASLEVCFILSISTSLHFSRRSTNSPITWEWMSMKIKNFFGLLLKLCLLLCLEIGKSLKTKTDKSTITIIGLCTCSLSFALVTFSFPALK